MVFSDMVLAVVQIFRGKVPSDSVGGPIMLANIAQVAASKGWEVFLWIMALISINLALLNLLPIPVKGSNVLEISYLNPRPTVAAEALNLLVELLKEKHLQVFSDPKGSFLTKQLQVYQEKLERSEEILQAFKHKFDLSSPIVEQQRRLLDQRATLDSNYKTIKNQLQGLAGKIASLDTQMKTILENIPVSTVEEGGNLEKAKADLFALKREEQKLLTKYTETSFPVLNLNTNPRAGKYYLFLLRSP